MDPYKESRPQRHKHFLCNLLNLYLKKYSILITITCTFLIIENTKVKHAHVVTSIKQSPVLKGHHFLVLS